MLALALTLFSCKKDKLKGDTAILKGTWNWINTQEVSNYCDADSLWQYSYIDSSDTGSTYALEFAEKGKVTFTHNGGTVWKDRIVFAEKNPINQASYSMHFIIHINNNDNNVLELWVGEDSLLVNDYPLDTDVNCKERFNHFVRQ